MTDKSKELTKSAGRNFSLYAEVGAYFNPKGDLNEGAFRQSLRKAFDEFKTLKLPTSPEEWLSTYLDRILWYLQEKNMTKALPDLFEIAIDEASALGIEKINLPTEHLKFFLLNARTSSAPVASRKLSDDEKDQVWKK